MTSLTARARAAPETRRNGVTSAYFRALGIAVTGLMMVGLTACGSRKIPEPKRAGSAAKGGEWGYFSGPVETRWLDDGVTMVLLNELRYTDPKGEVWVAPAGARVNGASIPRAFWTVIGAPFDGKYRNASVLHDVAYDEKTRPWQEVDRMFYNAMRKRCANCGGLH